MHAVVQAEDEDGDGGGGEQVGDEVDLQDGGGLEGDDDGGDDEQDDAEADEPDVEPVAEQVVGGRRDHGALQRVEGRARQRHSHDEHDAHDPRGQLLQQQEEGHAAVLRGLAGPRARPRGDAARHADEREDDEHGDARDAHADPQVAVRLGREGAQPEVGQEEVVGQHGHGEDVQQLPPEQARLGEARRVDEGWVDVRAHADRDGRDQDEAEDHDALDVVGHEGDLEATEGCGQSARLDRPSGRNRWVLVSRVECGDSQVYMVVTTHSTTKMGSASRPVRALTASPMADSSETMYRNMVTSVRKLSQSAVTTPYRWRVHSVRTKPSGHFFRMIGPRAAKTSSGSAEVSAYTTTPWTPAMVASCG